MDGELDRAIERYQRSIEVCPTAEAHTFMGWALSAQGRWDEATDECRHAIEIDPHFGNPATRYEPRQYPFMNLGRIYLGQGRWWEALRELEGAVRLAPNDRAARTALHALRARLN
jgi:tetratricopeptide (TPR) repeat protein